MISAGSSSSSKIGGSIIVGKVQTAPYRSPPSGMEARVVVPQRYETFQAFLDVVTRFVYEA